MAVASAKAREFGFDTFACASTGNLASAVARRAAGGAQDVRLPPLGHRAVQDPERPGLRGHPGGRAGHLRRRQPPLLGDRRPAQLGLLQHQRPPLLLRGVEDPGLRDGGAAGVGGPRPRGGPHRFRVAPDQDHQGLRRAGQDRADRAQSGARLRGPGAGCNPVASAFEQGWRRSSRCSARIPSPSPWPSATPRTATTSCASCASAGAPCRTPATRRSPKGCASSRRPKGSSPRRRAG